MLCIRLAHTIDLVWKTSELRPIHQQLTSTICILHQTLGVFQSCVQDQIFIGKDFFFWGEISAMLDEIIQGLDTPDLIMWAMWPLVLACRI